MVNVKVEYLLIFFHIVPVNKNQNTYQNLLGGQNPIKSDDMDLTVCIWNCSYQEV